MSGDMNFAAHGLHKTWPQGIVSTALIVFERFFSQAGHMALLGSEDDLGLGAVLKFIDIRDLRERLCLFSGEDAGHKGDILGDLTSCWL